jgi:hypothetical protein
MLPPHIHTPPRERNKLCALHTNCVPCCEPCIHPELTERVLVGALPGKGQVLDGLAVGADRRHARGLGGGGARARGGCGGVWYGWVGRWRGGGGGGKKKESQAAQALGTIYAWRAN